MNQPGGLPPNLPPEYAEAYRRGYQRAYEQASGGRSGEGQYDEGPTGPDQPGHRPAHRAPVAEPTTRLAIDECLPFHFNDRDHSIERYWQIDVAHEPL